MRYILSLLLLVNASHLCAQKITDKIMLKVQYSSTYKDTQEKKELSKDINLLEIGETTSRFYSQLFTKFRHTIDSVKNATSDQWEILNASIEADKAGRGQTYIVYKGIPMKGKLTSTDVVSNDFNFRYEEDITAPTWNLVEGDTTILGYACLKAVGELHGRTWEAWYAIDIPVDNGPWKLGGLPGLILAAKESEGIFSFLATGLEQADGTQTYTFNAKKYESISPLEFQRLIKDYWKDQWNTHNRLEGRGYSEPPSAQRSFNACLIEYYE